MPRQQRPGPTQCGHRLYLRDQGCFSRADQTLPTHTEAMFIIFAAACTGALRLPVVIDSNMVLQREKAAHLWGWADAGESVSAAIDGAEVAHTTADVNGTWSMLLPPQPASATGRNLTIYAASGSRNLTDVLFGEARVRGSNQTLLLLLPA
jgi:hypothetical protein